MTPTASKAKEKTPQISLVFFSLFLLLFHSDYIYQITTVSLDPLHPMLEIVYPLDMAQ